MQEINQKNSQFLTVSPNFLTEILLHLKMHETDI